MDALIEAFKIEYLIGPPVFVLLIFLALLLHEMGHYIAARLFRIRIESVVIGGGKTFKHWDDRHNTRWSIRRWPLGAHVHLSSFAALPFWQRALTILAGPLINFAILPFLFFGFYLAVGQPSTPPVLVGVETGLAADQAGLKPGDRFLAVDGMPVSNFQDIWRVAYSKGAVQSVYTIQRGEEIFDLPFTPGWTEYKDEDGITRKNTRFGVSWEHIPYKLSAVMGINGKDTRDNEDLARKLLLKNLDKDILIDLKGPDGKPRPFKAHLFAQVNPNLDNPDHEDYKRVYLGAIPGNIYLQQSVAEHFADALRYARALVSNLAGIPFQLFPIDPEVIKDGNAVGHPDTKTTNIFYKYMHLFAVASVIVGLVNLLPLPGLDGGQLLIQGLERARKQKISRKAKAKVFGLVFLILYLSVLFTNLDNIPYYIDSRAKKVHELINNSTPLKKEDEAGHG
jgi:regulator of sigma E protease